MYIKALLLETARYSVEGNVTHQFTAATCYFICSPRNCLARKDSIFKLHSGSIPEWTFVSGIVIFTTPQMDAITRHSRLPHASERCFRK